MMKARKPIEVIPSQYTSSERQWHVELVVKVGVAEGEGALVADRKELISPKEMEESTPSCTGDVS
jgi:hypothetical protein